MNRGGAINSVTLADLVGRLIINVHYSSSGVASGTQSVRSK